MSAQSLNLFSMPIAKFAVDKWENKKEKLLDIISFEGCEIVECQTDYYKYNTICLLYTSPSPRDRQKSRMPSSA